MVPLTVTTVPVEEESKPVWAKVSLYWLVYVAVTVPVVVTVKVFVCSVWLRPLVVLQLYCVLVGEVEDATGLVYE